LAGNTYFTQILEGVPGMEGLYMSDSKAGKEINRLTGCSGLNYDRRNRFLDYLLSLYGEDFKQKALKRYNYYDEGYLLEQALIDNKIAFLKSLISINKNRSKSFNYLEQSWNTENISGLKHKCMILLGIRSLQQVSYSDTFLKWGFRLVSEQPPNQSLGYFPDTEFANMVVNKEYIEQQFTKVPYMEVEQVYDYHETRELISSIEIFRNNTIVDTFLRFGVTLENFRVGTYEDSNNVIAVFRHPVKNEWQYVSSFKDLRTAREKINKARKFLILLNQDSEGMHVVEHILLRPQNDSGKFTFGITGKDGKELFLHPDNMPFEKREKMVEDIMNSLNDQTVFHAGRDGEEPYCLHLTLPGDEILVSRTTYASEESAREARTELLGYMQASKASSNAASCFRKYSVRGNGVLVPDDFYPMRISVVFPDWTSRFHNSKFRMLAEETVSGNAPAHIYSEYYWLNPENMEQFEMLYRIWLDEKMQVSSGQLETAAVNLISFLLQHERSGNIYT
jgi:hypothetical protein